MSSNKTEKVQRAKTRKEAKKFIGWDVEKYGKDFYAMPINKSKETAKEATKRFKEEQARRTLREMS